MRPYEDCKLFRHYSDIETYKRDEMISLTVNGETLTAPGPQSVAQFLEDRKIPTAAVAVAYNGNVLLRGEYASVVLQDGDRLEIVRMVGGG